MAESTIQAKRYAQAIFSIAQEHQDFEKWDSDLKKISILAQDPELVAVMENPKFDFQVKTKVLNLQLKEINQKALNLALLLTEREQFGLIKEIYQEYQGLIDDYFGRENAEVTTAIPLDENEKRNLTERLSNITGKKVSITEKVDPGIIGGIIIRVSGKIIDGSTSSRLSALKSELSNTTT